MNVSLNTNGDHKDTEKWLKGLQGGKIFATLEKFGEAGVNALAAATPIESGVTAQSWKYDIVQRSGYYSIVWSNTDNIEGITVVLLLQYGHATRTGGYVQGRDFVMPAITPIFDQCEAEFQKVVSK